MGFILAGEMWSGFERESAYLCVAEKPVSVTYVMVIECEMSGLDSWAIKDDASYQ